MRPSCRPAATSTAATPIAFVNAVLVAYEKYGVDPSAALAAARIAPALLRDPAAKITAWQFEVLTAGAMKELDDEALNPTGSWGSPGEHPAAASRGVVALCAEPRPGEFLRFADGGGEPR